MSLLTKFGLITGIFILLISPLYSQRGQYPGGGSAPKGSIQGIVKVKENNAPLEYANVVLYKQKDSSMVTGTVSGTDGSFKMEEVPFGLYYMEVDFIGFHKKIIPDVKVTPRSREENIGEVFLSEASREIEGVEVTADKVQVEYKVDKKVINVEKDFSAQGGSAVDVLENVPSIKVDIEGNVELRGTDNFRVLVNGKPTVLEGSEALQQLPANRISSIEVITNPSAKYDPEGTGGIINVIMKQDKRKGFNGRFKASAGTGDKYDASANLNYRTGKINFFTSFNYREFNFEMNGVSERDNFYTNDTATSINQDMERNMGRSGYSVKGGFDYYLTDNSTLSLAGKVGTFGFSMGANTQTTRISQPIDLYNYEISNSSFDVDHNYYTLSLDYQNKFDDNGHTLNASAFYSNADNNDKNGWENYLANSNWEKINDNPYKQLTNEKGTEDELEVKLDYTRPTGSGELELGYKGTYDLSDERYELEIYDNSQWTQQEASTIDYYRLTQALYATWSGKAIGIDYKLGLRGEYTDRELKQVTLDETYKIDRFNIFPSAHLSKKISRGEQIFLSYSRRINRPRSWFIDPFKRYINQYTVRAGNPGLEPEYTGSYELGYKKSFKKSFISIEGYFRNTTNEIDRIQRLGENDDMYVSFENLDRETAAGFETMFNSSLFKWWNLNASGSLYRYTIEGNVTDQDVSARSNNWNVRLNNNFSLPTGTKLQLMAMFIGPSATAQGEREGFFMTSASVKHSIMDNKLTFTLSGRDLLQTMQHEMTSSGPNFETYNSFEREAPVVTFSVSYSFNNYKDRKRGPNGDEGEEYQDMGTF